MPHAKQESNKAFHCKHKYKIWISYGGEGVDVVFLKVTRVDM